MGFKLPKINIFKIVSTNFLISKRKFEKKRNRRKFEKEKRKKFSKNKFIEMFEFKNI